MTKWIDVVTLAVPRNTIATTIPSLLEKMDRSRYHLRWIVHYDPIDCLQSEYARTLKIIHDLKTKFDESVILTPSKNIGHAQSFWSCLKCVKSDFLYWEDDKYCTRSFNLRDLVTAHGDHISLQGRAGRPGHTSASFWRKSIADSVLISWPEAGMHRCLEDWLKRHCRNKGFRGGPHFRCAKDVGIHSLAGQSVQRIRGNDGNPRYISAKKDFMFATYVTNNTLNSFLKNYSTWQWRLCIDSFPFRVFAPIDLHSQIKIQFSPSSQNQLLEWNPSLPSDNDELFYAFLEELAELPSKHIAYLHPRVAANKKATQLDYEQIARADVFGCPDRARWIQFQKTSWLRNFLIHHRNHNCHLPVDECLWEREHDEDFVTNKIMRTGFEIT